MKKLFISMPMSGMSREEIVVRMAEAKSDAERIVGEPVELIDSVFDYEAGISNPVEYIGKAIIAMSQADHVYFAVGWKNARGCRVEHVVAVSYDMSIIDENMEGLNG